MIKYSASLTSLAIAALFSLSAIAAFAAPVSSLPSAPVAANLTAPPGFQSGQAICAQTETDGRCLLGR
jgi:hypothetical protein